MRILIQNKENGQFYSAPGQWTSEIGQARAFVTALSAYDFSQLHNLGETEVVFKIPKRPLQKILSYSHFHAAHQKRDLQLA